MFINLDKHSGVPIFRQIVEQVKKQILTGQLAEGEQLASVKKLAEDLHVNPMTVSKSYSLLEYKGFVERQRGIGLFVTKPKAELTKRAKVMELEKVLEGSMVQAFQLGFEEKEVIEIVRRLFEEVKEKSRGK